MTLPAGLLLFALTGCDPAGEYNVKVSASPAGELLIATCNPIEVGEVHIEVWAEALTESPWVWCRIFSS